MNDLVRAYVLHKRPRNGGRWHRRGHRHNSTSRRQKQELLCLNMSVPSFSAKSTLFLLKKIQERDYFRLHHFALLQLKWSLLQPRLTLKRRYILTLLHFITSNDEAIVFHKIGLLWMHGS